MTATTDPKRRPGRPPGPDPKTERVEIRMTPKQRDKLSRLGGPEWLRRAIDRARVQPDRLPRTATHLGLTDFEA